MSFVNEDDKQKSMKVIAVGTGKVNGRFRIVAIKTMLDGKPFWISTEEMPWRLWLYRQGL